MIQFQKLVENLMTEQGMNVPSELKANNQRKDSVDDDEWTLKIGDQISLYMETDHDGNPVSVFMSGNGFLTYDSPLCGVATGKNQIPSNFKECVFIVHNQNQYAAATEYQKKLEMMGSRRDVYRDTPLLRQSTLKAKKAAAISSSSSFSLKKKKLTGSSMNDLNIHSALIRNKITTTQTGNDAVDPEEELKILYQKYEREMEQNRIEAERNVGNEVLYGQPIQLLHLKSKKFLTVSRESAQLQKECVRLVLDENGNANSIFYIMPYYKFRTEGQKVLISDQVRLWSRKSNQYLHLSKLKFDERRREINMSTTKSMAKWRMRLFTPFVDPNVGEKFLKAGDVIRLCHQETGAYLDVDLEKSNAVRLRYENDRSVNQTSNTIWEIENADPSRGGALTWHNMYRLRHLATNRYLTIHLQINDNDSDSDDEEEPSEHKPVTSNKLAENSGSLFPHTSSKPVNPIVSKWQILRKKVFRDKDITNNKIPLSHPQSVKRYDLFVDELSASSSLFTLQSPNLGGNNIQVDSYMRIKHHQTGSWLRLVPKEQVNAAVQNQHLDQGGSHLNEATYLKIESSSVLSEEDVFSIQIVPHEQIEDLLFIQSTIPILDIIRYKLMKELRPTRSEMQKAIATLAELCIFCTDSHIQDALRREGIPYTKRQDYLREQLVLHKVMDIIKYFKVNPKDLEDEKHYVERELLKHAYRFIKQSVKQNSKNGLQLASYIDFIQSQLSISAISKLGVSEALVEMLTNNYELLSMISESQVEFFVNLLLDEPRRSDYVKFLNAILCTEDKAVVNNQNVVRKILFHDREKMKNKLIIPYLDNDKIMVSIDGAVMELRIFISYCLATGFRARYGKDFLNYTEYTIELFSRLCMERNMDSIIIISELLSLELILKCIEEPDLTPSMKSSFCSVLLNCYIDRAPYEKKPLIKITRSWHKGKVKEKKKEDALAVKIQDIKHFIAHFFVCNTKIDKANVDLNYFILNLVKIARTMLEFRILSDVNEVSSLLSNLFRLLDGRSDVKHQKPIPDKERYCADEENSVVTAIKLEIIKICNLFIDIGQNRKISFFINDFKQRADTTESFHWKGNKEIDDAKLLYLLFNYQVNRKPCTILDKEKVKTNLLDILQDLTKYENSKLSKLSLNLIFRIYYQKEELSRYLSRIEMLVSRTMMRSYNDLSINISELRRLIIGGATFQMQGAAAEKAKLLIEEICKETQSAGSRAQRILRNLKAHEIALQILKINFFDESVRDLLWRWSIRLLIDFVKHNPENQKILWSKLDIFFPKLKFPETTILLVEIVQNNRNLCLTIEEKLVRNYIDTLAEQKVLEPRFLYFLRAIVMPEGKPLKKNQFFVVNNMLQRGRDVIVLFTGKAGIKERNKRIQRNEHITEPQGILNYHIELLHLFCDCAEGSNHVAEVKLQALLSLESILQELIDPFLIPTLRNPLTRFLNEVYINTEKDSLKFVIQTNEKIWILFEKMNSELEYFISTKGMRKPKVETGEATEQSSTSTSAVTSPTVVAPTGIDNLYIYRLMIPLLYFYFFKHFPPPILLEHHEKISKQIVYNLTVLFSRTANPMQREVIKKCAQAMYKRRLDLRSSTRAIDQFFARIYADTSNPVEFTRVSRPKLDEKDEKLIHQIIQHAKGFKVLLLRESDIKNAATLYMSEESLQTLVTVLRRINNTGYDQHSILTMKLSLRTLQRVIQSTIDKDDAVQVDKVLKSMVCANAHLLILELLCCPHDRIVKEALELGNLLLYEGNKHVQKSFLQTFIETDSDTFFIAMRDRIRLAIKEIKLRRDFEKKHKERFKAMNETNRVLVTPVVKKGDNNYLQKLQDNFRLQSGDLKLEDEKFVETGYIREILRFLQLMTEGHYLPMQEYLNTQFFNGTSVNLVRECLQYLLALENYIDSSTVNIAIQSFETLTEFIQGPCSMNQNDIGMTPNLYFMANEILQDSVFDTSVFSIDKLKLKRKLILTLQSLLEGTKNVNVYNLMLNSLNIDVLKSLLLESAAVHQNSKDEHLLADAYRDINALIDIGIKSQYTPQELANKMKNVYKKLGLQIYFLFNTFKDQELAASTKSEDTPLAVWLEQNKTYLACFASMTGRIEISRGNKLERVYFRKPDLSANLIEETKKSFLFECNRESAQNKVFDLYNATNKFRIEMEHYENFKFHNGKISLRKTIDAALWSFFEKFWHIIRLFTFIYSLVMNIFLCCTVKMTYDAVYGEIPIPGTTLPVLDKMVGSYTQKEIITTMFVLGIFQIIVAFLVFVIYMYFFAPLKVKKRFNLKRIQKWEDLEFNFQFVKTYIWFSLQDWQIWFYVFYIAICLIGLLVTPAVYCILLFEVILHSPSLITAVTALKQNVKGFLLLLALVSVLMFFYSIVYFVFKYQAWNQFGQFFGMCNTLWRCSGGFYYFELRNGGLPESGNYDNMGVYTNFGRALIDLSFTFIVPMLLLELVFGLVLDSFGDLRRQRAEREALIRDRCFICDIERQRFDIKANENINFIDHIKNDHYMWNYVFFLIYLFKKKRTEYTGTEQYIYDLAMKDDISFFPILRSMMLEESETRHRIKHAKLKKKIAPVSSTDSGNKESPKTDEKAENKKRQSVQLSPSIE